MVDHASSYVSNRVCVYVVACSLAVVEGVALGSPPALVEGGLAALGVASLLGLSIPALPTAASPWETMTRTHEDVEAQVNFSKSKNGLIFRS